MRECHVTVCVCGVCVRRARAWCVLTAMAVVCTWCVLTAMVVCGRKNKRQTSGITLLRRLTISVSVFGNNVSVTGSGHHKKGNRFVSNAAYTHICGPMAKLMQADVTRLVNLTAQCQSPKPAAIDLRLTPLTGLSSGFQSSVTETAVFCQLPTFGL